MAMFKKIVFTLFIGLIALACSSDSDPSTDNGNNDSSDPDSGNPTESFDRGAVLENWADNIILPAYRSFVPQVADLNDRALAFAESVDQSNLDALRTAWLEAYKGFQWVSMFEIGEAEALRFRSRMNIYPVDVDNLNQAVIDGNVNLELPSTNDIQGFPALDYLLYGGAGTDQDILDRFSTGPNAAAYRSFLTLLTQTMLDLSSAVLNDWEGEYRDTFVSNTDSSASGSLDKMVNDFMFYYEKALRAGKVGIPAGVFSSEPLPDRVEGLYRSDVSRLLALEALQASQDFFNGVAFGSSSQGNSLKAYLDYLNAIKNGEDLAVLINNQFEAARMAILDLDENFSEQISTNNSKMLQAYDELQRNVVLMKVDMFQALSINVDYVDADGD